MVSFLDIVEDHSLGIPIIISPIRPDFQPEGLGQTFRCSLALLVLVNQLDSLE